MSVMILFVRLYCGAGRRKVYIWRHELARDDPLRKNRFFPDKEEE